MKVRIDPLKGNRVFLVDEDGGEVYSKYQLIFDRNNIVIKERANGKEFKIITESLKDTFEAITGKSAFKVSDSPNGLYIALVEEGTVSLYPFEGVEIKNVDLVKSKEKESFKVYETPVKTFEIVASLLERANAEGFLTSYRRLYIERFLQERQTLAVLFDIYGVPTNRPELLVERLLKDLENEEKLRKLQEAFKGNAQKSFENLLSRLRLYRELRDKLEKGDYKSVLKALEKEGFTSVNIYEKQVLPVIDFQAGSGKILEVLKERGLNAELYGTEIRKLQSYDLDNRVLYGVDFSIFAPLWRNELITTKEGKYASSAVYYLNPPYTSNREITRQSILSVPQNAVIFGLFSSKDIPLLEKNVEGFIFEVPREITGYKEENNPETFAFVVGIRKKQPQRVVKRRIEDWSELYPVLEENRNLWEDLLLRFTNSLREINRLKRGAMATHIADLRTLFRNTYQRYREAIDNLVKLAETEPQKLVQKFSLIDEALKGEKIFPDARIVGKKRFLSYKEALSNPALVQFYKEAMPAVYELLKAVAEETGEPLPIVEREGKELVTTTRLGLTVFKFYPKIFNVEEVEEVLRELVPEGEKLQTALNVASKVVVKARPVLTTSSGEALFGYTPVLVLTDSLGKDLATVSINIAEFYEKLKERGVISLEDRIELADPDRDYAERLLKGYLKHLSEVFEYFGVKPEEAFDKSILPKLVKRIKDKLTDDVLSLTDVEAEVSASVYETLKSLGREGELTDYSKPVKEIIDNFKKYPFLFSLLTTPEDVKKEEERLKARGDDKKLQILKSLPWYPDGSKAYVENLVKDSEVAQAVMQGLGAYLSLEEKVRSSAIRLVKQLQAYPKLEKLLSEGKTEDALKEFTDLFINRLGIKPHQFYEALRVGYKAEKTGEKGHILGWEMRAGKTLAMVLSGYFKSLVEESDTYLFPRSANITDIALQVVEFVPQLAKNLRVYKVSTTEVPVVEDRKGEILSSEIYPNLLAINEFKKMLVGRGKTQSDLLKTYTKEIEELIGLYRDAERRKKVSPILKSDRDTASILLLPGFDEATKYAVATYIKRLKDRGLLKVNSKSWDKVIANLTSLGRRLAKEKKSFEEFKKENRFVFNVVPKSSLEAISYFIEQPEKKLFVGSLPATLNFDGEVKELSPVDVGELSGKAAEDLKIVKSFYPSSPEKGLWLLASTDEEPLKDLINDIKGDYFNRSKFILAVQTASAMLGKEAPSEEEIDKFLNAVKDGEVNVEIEGIKFADVVYIDKKYQRREPTTLYAFVPQFDYENGDLYKLAMLLYTSFSYYTLTPADYIRHVLKLSLEKITSSKLAELFEAPRGTAVEFSFYIDNAQTFPKPVKVGKDGFDIVPVSFVGRATDPENPLEVAEYTVPLQGITIVGKDRNIELRIRGEWQKPALSSEGASKNYFIHSQAFEGKSYSVILDEADEAISPESSKYRGFYFLSRNANLRIAATGTPTTGDVKSPVALLGLVSDLSISAIAKSMNSIEENFATYSFSGHPIAGVFATIVANLQRSSVSPSDFWRQVLSLPLSDYGDKDDMVEKTERFLLILREANENSVGETIDQGVEYELSKALTSLTENDVKAIARFLKKLQRDMDDLLRRGYDYEEAFLEFLTKNRYKKIAPGTFDPIGLVSVLQGASVSFQTREQLKQLVNPNIREKKIVRDANHLIYAVKEPLRFHEILKTKGESKDELFRDYPTRVFNDVDKVFSYYRKAKIHQWWEFLTVNFASYLEAVKRNPEAFIKRYNLDISKDEFKSVVERSGKTTADDVYSLVREYLLGDNNWEAVEKKLGQKDDAKKRLELAKLLWNDYLEHIIPAINTGANIDEIETDEGNTLLINGKVSFPLKVSIPSVEDGRPSVRLSPDGTLVLEGWGRLYFVEDLLFQDEDWEEIVKPGESASIDYLYRLVGGDEEEIIDIYTNRGFKEYYKRLAEEGKSFLVAPSRVATLGISILDTLSMLYKYKTDKKPYQVLIRIRDKETEEVLSKIDTQKLLEKGITVKVFKDHSLLDLEVKKFKADVKSGKTGMVVIAPAKTIARGVDLSALDTIVIPGTVQGSGKDFSQLTARVFNNTDKHTAEIYLFGAPLKLKPFFFAKDADEAEERATLGINYTGIVQGRLLQKDKFIYEMMSGRLVNVLSETDREVEILDEELKRIVEEAPEAERNYEREVGF